MKHLEKWRVCSCQLAIMLTYRFGTKPLIVCILLALTLFVISLNMGGFQSSSTPQPTNHLRDHRTTTSKQLSKVELQSLRRSSRQAITNTLGEYNQRSQCHGEQIVQNLDLFPELNHFNSCRRIFYNRVPKCGSRSVLSTVKILGDMHRFHVYASPRPQHQSYFSKIAYEDAFVLNFTTFPEPFFYSQHLHFVNFTSYGLQPPIYINVIRDPLQRLLSHYFYGIFGSNGAPYSSPMPNKLTLEQCIEKAGKGCATLLNTVVPFFCGHRKNCRQPTISRQALSQAKRTVSDSYLVVGLQEDLFSFMEVLETLMPRFFSNATTVYQATEQEFKQRFATVQKPTIAPHIATTLRKLLASEYEFYYFIKQRFYNLHNKVISLRQGESNYRSRSSIDAQSSWNSNENIYPRRRQRT